MGDDDACHFNVQCWMFFAQVFFSFLVILFCMLMIFVKNEQVEVYLPLMTSTASVWVPTPTIPRRIKRERSGGDNPSEGTS
jgi:hypothetical protein